MVLKALSDRELVKKVQDLRRRENLLLKELIEHLQEMENRKLYSSLGYQSLYDYCCRSLGYTKDQAYFRIKSLKLVSKLPEAKESLARGELTLTTATMLANHLQRNPKSNAHEVLERIKKQPVSEVKKVFAVHKQEQERVYKFRAKKELQEKIEYLQDLLSHKTQGDLESLVEEMVELTLKKYDLKRKKNRPSKKVQPTKRTIPNHLKKQVLARDRHQCQRCHSKRYLQIDHIRPYALGGKSELNNLRVLCRNCNQRAAMEIFGVEKINSFRFKTKDGSVLKEKSR